MSKKTISKQGRGQAEKGLIKEIILISIGLFLLTQAGIDWEQVLEADFWRGLWDNLPALWSDFIDFLRDLLAKIRAN